MRPFWNIGMHSMQDLFFLARWVEMVYYVPNVLISVTEKSITFKITKISRYFTLTEKKTNFIWTRTGILRSIVANVNTSKQKWNASVPRWLLSLSQPLFGLVTHDSYPFLPCYRTWITAQLLKSSSRLVSLQRNRKGYLCESSTPK